MSDALEEWAAATADGSALGPAAEAYERMQRLWAVELAARAELEER
ncbi:MULTISPECIES: hypothetical protein [Actinokineospora]|uniref:Uncharacterized protein n=1 Tax=Actinokineospora fastidiosa TaxID=1816 RepID=A0A918GKK1_9PSEU|nr:MULTISPECIES: hypothetical protein [Actinokineospora]UVS77631.1 hypothetical protein Actkin_01350 [Actinokineospora sp. UTMC 2448]GGS42079.1 hypothetical protein GCM10010171_41070 [Actinokineospora fastidiosa]